MSFIFFPSPTPVFPTLPPVAWSVHKKPIMASRVVIGSTGRETQLATAAYPRWSFILTYGGSSWLRDQTQNINPDMTLVGFNEFQAISSLFLLCRGSYGEFYFEDPDDSSRLGMNVGWGDGNRTVFPLQYSWGTGPFNPPLYAPVGGIKSIEGVFFSSVGGSPIAQDPSTYWLDDTKTQLVFASPPSPSVYVLIHFHFYYRCRFLDDHLDFEQFSQNLWEAKEIRFESVKA